MGRSPNLNFGRMPAGYRISSGNTARLVAAGKRFRGGPSTLIDSHHLAGVAPMGRLEGDPVDSSWGGHHWREWLLLSECKSALPGEGLYRIRGLGDRLVYIGEGAIRRRLDTHRRKTLDPTSMRPQDTVLRRYMPLEFSAVYGPWQRHERLELETDLIAAQIQELGTVPPAQFIG